ncbi:MAG: phosphoribosylglycinamide formyltransferase [Nitrococcus mobilis]|nr:phosphoribosylglycinamide formyltransferase [Nitrococcus mobilis]
MPAAALRVVVLISGYGSNLQVFIDGQNSGHLPIDIQAVISNRADAYGLVRAERAGIEHEILPQRDFADRQHYDRALRDRVAHYRAELVIMAGFMRILTPVFVSAYEGRLINIHPSLLPALRGLHTHERVLQAGLSEHGCSVHYVTPELDAGPVIIQARVPVHRGDRVESLQQRVQRQEYRIYPLAVRWIAEGRIEMRDGAVWYRGQRQDQPPVVTAADDLDRL